MKHGANPYQQFVTEHARLFQRGKKLAPVCPPKSPRQPKLPADAPKALVFSPHPDDECLVGGLALRLLGESKWRITNVAVTLGSRPGRRPSRLRELRNACAVLGFDLVSLNLPNITPAARKKNWASWQASVKGIAKILAEHQPRVIFIPHDHDGHFTHVGTHLLVLDALQTLPAPFKCHVVETEFWGQMTDPNLLAESGAEDVGVLVAALACHVGEVRRNPYQARMPAWLMDNVRRGAERVGGQGGAAPDFTFATLYRLRRWANGRLVNVLKRGKFLSATENPAGLFPQLR